MKNFIYLLILFFFSCLNQKSINKEKKIDQDFMPEKSQASLKVAKNMETIIVGGGCFWCTESVYRALRGIITVESGYSGGKEENATYKLVSTGTTEHAEVVKIEFNTAEISLEEVLLVFMSTHTPTTLNRQGNDIGREYRSVIFYADDNQKKVAEKLISELQSYYEDKIVTEISSLKGFFKAEDYHQNFYAKNPNQAYCKAVISPKIEKLRKLFADKMR